MIRLSLEKRKLSRQKKLSFVVRLDEGKLSFVMSVEERKLSIV